MPRGAFAMPPVQHPLDIEKSIWRNQYRDNFFMALHKYTALDALNEYQTDNAVINEAIKLRMEGNGKDALAHLKTLTVKKGAMPGAEILFLTGLINESMGFYPEASANYAMVEVAPNGADFLRRTMLRRSFVKFIEAINSKSLFAMIDADGGFFRVYNESDKPGEWSEALAGHALVLYNFGDHKHAETVFASFDSTYLMGPAYQFARAENYVSLGLYLNAIDLFERLKLYLIENKEIGLASYISLRLGDLYLMSGNDADATANYNQILVDRNKDTPLSVDDGFIMQSMALAEYHIKKEEHVEAIETLRVLLGGKLPPMFEIERTAGLYLIDLFKKVGFEEDAFLEGKSFLRSFPDTKWSPEVRAFVDEVVGKRIKEAYVAGDFQKVLYHYHVSLEFVTDSKLLVLVGTAFVERKLPEDAKKIFAKLVQFGAGAGDCLVGIGLARSEIMLGNAEAATQLITSLKPIGGEEERYYAAACRELGDLHFKKAGYQAAVWGYEAAGRFIKDSELDLRLAMSLGLSGRPAEALKIYTALVLAKTDAGIKGRAHLGKGDIYFAQKKWNDAFSDFDKAARMVLPEYRPEVFYKLGEVSSVLGRKIEALKAWKSAVKAGEESGGEEVFTKLAEERLKEARAWEQIRM